MSAGPRAEGRRELQTQAVLRAAIWRARVEHWPAIERQRLMQALVAWRRQRAWQAGA